MKTIRTILLLSFTAVPAFSQSIVSFSGYAVQFPVYQRFDETMARLFGYEEQQGFDLTRIRLRPSVSLGDESFLMMEYEVSALYIFNDIGFTGPGGGSPRQVVDLRWDPATGSRWFVSHFVDRFYYRTSMGPTEFTVGRQRIAWGSGRIWNPTDLFNPVNPTSFSKIEKDGVDAATAKVSFGEFTDATLVWNPQKDRASNCGLRLRSNAYGFDGALVGGYFDRHGVAGADIAGSVFDAGIRVEMATTFARSRSEPNTVRWVFGMDNQFTEKLYTLVEIQFNGAGTSDRFHYELLRLFSGEIINVGKQYGTIQVSYLLSPRSTLTGSWMQSWTDGSGFMGTSAQFSISDETAASAGVQYFHGSAFSEFSFFPTSLFLRVDTFF